MALFPAEYITKGVETYLDKQNTGSQKTNGFILFIVIVALCSLSFIRVDVSVQENGFLSPMTEKTEIKSCITELVDSVYVREGKKLKQGDTILTFRTVQLEMKSNYRKKQLKNVRKHLNDLQILSNGDIPVHFSSGVQEQQSRLYKEELRKYEYSFRKAEKILNRNIILFNNNLISAEEYEGYYFEYEQARNELNAYRDMQLSKWKNDYNQYKNTYEELLFTACQEDKEKDLYVITSPITGTLDFFRGIYAGSLLNSGSILAIISPDSLICAEIHVSPQHIAHIFVDMPVNIQVSSFNYLEWGGISGKVTDISSDFLIDPVDNSLYYNVKCELDRNYLVRKDGRKGMLKKGMLVTSYFKVTERSVFDFLWQSLDEWINPKQLKKAVNKTK